MKPFKINRNSWHYKLNKHFFNEYEHSMEWNWEPRNSDFCSYWRATFFRMVGAATLSLIIIFFVFMVGSAIYYEPFKALMVVSSIILFFVLFACGIWVSEKIRSVRKTNSESLFVQKYRAHKSKICPMVEYD